MCKSSEYFRCEWWEETCLAIGWKKACLDITCVFLGNNLARPAELQRHKLASLLQLLNIPQDYVHNGFNYDGLGAITAAGQITGDSSE